MSKKKGKLMDTSVFKEINDSIYELVPISTNVLSLSKAFLKNIEDGGHTINFNEYAKEIGQTIEDETVFIDLCIELLMRGLIVENNRTKERAVYKIKGTNKVFSVDYVDGTLKEQLKLTKAAETAKSSRKPAKQEEKKVVEVKPFELSEDEILGRATAILESASRNSTQGVIDIFEAISVPFKDRHKRKVFEKTFELAKIDAEWRDDIGFVVFSKHRTKKAVVSHMDLIKPFEKGFAEGKVYQIEENKLIGALDNTFTNAVVINSILNKQCKETTYLFTLDEETTQYAIRDYMKLFGNEQFIINLDVTNEGMSHNMSIEYDEPSWNICHQINDNLNTPFFTRDRVCDDLDEVLKANGKGLSYCLPTDKTIHSYKNYTLLEKIEPYMAGLDFLIHEMCIKDSDHNVKHISIKKALKCKTLKKLKKKDVKKTYSWSGGSKTYTGGSSRQTVMWEDEESLLYNRSFYNDSETSMPGGGHRDISEYSSFHDVVIALTREIEPSFQGVFSEFVGEYCFSEESFSKETFLNYGTDQLFSKLKLYGMIDQTHVDEYVFDLDILNNTKFQILKKAIDKAGKVLELNKFARFLFMEVEDKFSALDVARYHKDKTQDTTIQIEDAKDFIYAIITLGYIDSKDGYFYIQ